jgi:hypothetical protein
MSDWISVCDKLPEENQEVMMSYNNLVSQGRYKNNKFYYPSSCAHIEGYCNCEDQEGITHWMELPKPPESET